MPAYLVTSSDPINAEDSMSYPVFDEYVAARKGIRHIAQHLHRMSEDSAEEPVELVIAVHTSHATQRGTKAHYSDIFRFAAQANPNIRTKRNCMFIGYIWPCEVPQTSPRAIYRSIKTLPTIFQWWIAVGGVIVFLSFCWQAYQSTFFSAIGIINWFQTFLLLYALFILSTVLALLGIYFRNSYRAENSGIRDLVELLRQIDRSMTDTIADSLLPPDPGLSERAAVNNKAKAYWNQPGKRIKLSFISHGIGSLIVLKAVHFLSDIFNYSPVSASTAASHHIGNIYELARIILVAPDIPALTLISEKSNFFNSSLRRFSESYLFCNEGDMVLRLFSTFANIVAFPSRNKSRGARLGTVILNSEKYGVINLPSLHKGLPAQVPIEEAIAQSSEDALSRLCLSSLISNARKDNWSLAEMFIDKTFRLPTKVYAADLCTYFDCTDYKDFKVVTGINGSWDRSKTSESILIRGGHKRLPKLLYSLRLYLDIAWGKRDGHGGYFFGEFTRELIYQLAFLGFEGYLKTLDSDPMTALSMLDSQCKDKGIKGFLSPFRYRIDVQKEVP